MPAAIENKPYLTPCFELYLEAFYDLTTTRPIGYGGLGPISWLSVRQYAIIMGYDHEQTYFLHLAVQRLDPLYLSWSKTHAERAK